jgi:hypothetical protein
MNLPQGYWPVRYEDVFRVDLLEKARSTNKHGLLVCEECGFAWLTLETAKIDASSDGLGVRCFEMADCMRRQRMNMKLKIQKKKKRKK